MWFVGRCVEIFQFDSPPYQKLMSFFHALLNEPVDFEQNAPHLKCFRHCKFCIFSKSARKVRRVKMDELMKKCWLDSTDMARGEKNIGEGSNTSSETSGASAKEQSGQLWMRVATPVTPSSCLSFEVENCEGAGTLVAVNGRANCRGNYAFNVS